MTPFGSRWWAGERFQDGNPGWCRSPRQELTPFPMEIPGGEQLGAPLPYQTRPAKLVLSGMGIAQKNRSSNGAVPKNREIRDG